MGELVKPAWFCGLPGLLRTDRGPAGNLLPPGSEKHQWSGSVTAWLRDMFRVDAVRGVKSTVSAEWWLGPTSSMNSFADSFTQRFLHSCDERKFGCCKLAAGMPKCSGLHNCLADCWPAS